MGSKLQVGIVCATLFLGACEVQFPGGNKEEEEKETSEVSPPKVLGLDPSRTNTENTGEAQSLGHGDSLEYPLRMSVTELSRSNGILTLKADVILLEGPGGRYTLLAHHEDVYLVSGDQKYLMLEDNTGDLLAANTGFLTPTLQRVGGRASWWAKYPAPPAEVKRIDVYFKGFMPIENVPISDK